MQSYPWKFGTSWWYYSRSFFSPLWGRSDEASMSLLADEWPEAKTRVYYGVYERNIAMSNETRSVLDRAQLDVEQSGIIVTFILHALTQETATAVI